MKDLCWILCDLSHSYFWSGAGFRKLGQELSLFTIPQFPSREEARCEARRLKVAVNVTAVPTRVRYL